MSWDNTTIEVFVKTKVISVLGLEVIFLLTQLNPEQKCNEHKHTNFPCHSFVTDFLNLMRAKSYII